jgi:hypothetical protein
MSDLPVPPPHGWTLTEAAVALDPDGWHEANFDEDAWAADPTAAEAARERFRVRFVRTMELAKCLHAKGVKVKPSHDGTLTLVEHHDWSIARARFKFDWYPPPSYPVLVAGPKPDSIVLQDGRVIAGVRIFAVERKTPVPRLGAGGRPENPDWPRFDQQVVRRLTLDGGHLTRPELRHAMKDWAAENMKDLIGPHRVVRDGC